MISSSDTTFSRALGDGLLERYKSWRHESEAVQRAYEAWIGSDPSNRELGYAGYLAALDQEELAAEAYRDELAWVRRMAR
jgi:hypothetical protein